MDNANPEGPVGKSLTTPGQRRDAALGKQDVRLGELDIGALLAVVEALVMVVHRDRDYQVSQRHACVLIGVDPKTVQRERPPDHAEIH